MCWSCQNTLTLFPNSTCIQSATVTCCLKLISSTTTMNKPEYNGGKSRPENNCMEESEEHSEPKSSSRSQLLDSETPQQQQQVENCVTLDDVEEQLHQEIVTQSINFTTQKTWISYLLGIELVMILHGIGYQGMTVIVQNFYMDRICRISENFTAEICDTLLKNATNERVIEIKESDYVVYQTSLEMVLPVVFACFLGPFTDKHGTKPIIILSLFGYFLSSVMYIVALFCPLLPPYYILICSVPIAVTGGSAAFVISTFGYVMKNSSSQHRSFRLSLLGIVWDVGSLVGCLAGPEIFKAHGFLPVFILASCAYLAGIFVTVIFVWEERLPEPLSLESENSDESIGSESDVKTCSTKLCCNMEVQDMLSVSFKRREGNIRRLILCLGICLPLQQLAYNSKTTYQYLYVRTKYDWDEVSCSYYTAATSLIGTVGGVTITLIFFQWLKVKDIYILTLNVLSNMFGYVTFGFSTLGWHMYLGSAIQMFGSTAGSVIRAMLSKLVPTDEQGKLLTFFTCAELTMPFLASGIYREIYTHSLSTFPGAIFIAASLIYVTILGILIYVWLSSRHQNNYTPIVSEE